MKTPIKLYKKVKKCYESFEEAAKALFADRELTWDPVLVSASTDDEVIKAFIESNCNLESAIEDLLGPLFMYDKDGSAFNPVTVETYPTPLGYYAYVVTNYDSGEIIRYRHLDEVAEYLLYDCFLEGKSLKKFCKELTETIVW